MCILILNLLEIFVLFMDKIMQIQLIDKHDRWPNYADIHNTVKN